MFLGFLFAFFSPLHKNREPFSQGFNLAKIVPGNWSCRNIDEKKVLFFIVLGYRQFQALLDDKFFNINVTQPDTAVIEWKSYSIPLTFANYSTNQYFSFYEIDSKYSLQVNLLSPHYIDILIMDKETKQFHHWFFAKTIIPTITIKDVLKVSIFTFLIIYLTAKLISSIRSRYK